MRSYIKDLLKGYTWKGHLPRMQHAGLGVALGEISEYGVDITTPD